MKDEELKKKDDEYHSLALALAAYDYSVNGNKEALQFLSDELAKQRRGSDAQAVVPLGFIDEWDLTIAAFEKHFARGADGAAAEASMLFWEQRQYLYPESSARFHKERVAAAKLDAESLRGVWKGSKDGVSVELRLGDNQGWEVRQGDKLIKADLTTHAWQTGKAVTLMAPRASKGRFPADNSRAATTARFGSPSGRIPAKRRRIRRVSEIVLTRQAGEGARKSEAGAKLNAATEAQLDWGEAVNGLRGAVVVRSPGPGKPQGIYLAVQNVSPAPLRFADTIAAEELRKLYVSDSEGILFALSSGEPTQTDVLLQPREVAYPAHDASPIKRRRKVCGGRTDRRPAQRLAANLESRHGNRKGPGGRMEGQTHHRGDARSHQH